MRDGLDVEIGSGVRVIGGATVGEGTLDAEIDPVAGVVPGDVAMRASVAEVSGVEVGAVSCPQAALWVRKKTIQTKANADFMSKTFLYRYSSTQICYQISEVFGWQYTRFESNVERKFEHYCQMCFRKRRPNKRQGPAHSSRPLD